MVQVADIIASVVMAVIIIAASVYLFAIYCHPDEQGIGNSPLLKVLVIASQAVAWGNLLLLPLDLSLTPSNPHFVIAYDVYYPVMLVLIAFLNPFAINFYESDEADSVCSRVVWSGLFAGLVALIWCGWVFISYVWLGVYDNPQGESVRISAAVYILLAMGLVGWILLALHGAIGLVHLPIDLIMYFAKRPQQLSTQEALDKKLEMQTYSTELITEGERLKSQAEELAHFEGGWFSKKRAQSNFDSKLNKYKKKVNALEEDYEVFDGELKVSERHPIVYVLGLVGGILGIVGGIIWVLQMMGTAIRQGGQPLFLLIDGWLGDISTGSASFVATILYAVMVLYMQVCVVKGNTTFGIRIPFLFKLHPMAPNKTYMNSLLFNSNLMLLTSLSSTLLALWAFPTYLASSSLGQLNTTAFNNLKLYGSFYGQRIPMIVMLCLVGLVATIAIIRAACKCRSDSKEKPKRTSRK